MPYYGWGYADGNSAWYNWGRWVLLGVVIAVALASFLVVRWHAIVQVRHGHHPTTGTGWMVPPSYYQSQQQHYDEAAPPYNPNISHADAGYYDERGNFIAKSDSQPPYDSEHQGASYPMSYINPADVGPPAHPPPNAQAADTAGPPAGPPPAGPPPTAGSSQGATASDYYPAPEPPAPVKR